MASIALVGLGKMGFNLALNLLRNGHVVLAHDLSVENMDKAQRQGVQTAGSLSELCKKMKSPRIIWIMIPAGPGVDKVIDSLIPELEKGDIIIEGGNAFYKDSVRRYEQLAPLGIHFLDCGTSGGTSGALNGACTMIGGDETVFKYCENIFKDISVENGYQYCGPAGSGHFVKMVHNGIEYGMMQSIAEGFEVLAASDYDFDFQKIAKVWNHGSVIRSWLMELTESAFSKDPRLDEIMGIMYSSGEGKWTLETALDLGIPTPVIALSLIMRYRSQQDDSFAGKVVAALRNEFGGHEVAKR